MVRNPRAFFFVAAGIVVVYAMLFPLLTIDTLTRVFASAARFEAGNLLLLLFMEVSRLVTSVVGLTIALYLLLRASNQGEARAFAVFLLFAIITYEKLLGGSAYPGPVQERTAVALIGAGVPVSVLSALFGPRAWTIWPALAALLRFSAVFPRELQYDMLDASGADDRRGLLRGSAVAGLDIGGLFRRLSRRLLSLRAFSGWRLGAFAVVMMMLHPALSEASVVLWVAGGIVTCIAITNVRAGYGAAQGTDRVRATWITVGFVLALFMFLLGTALYVAVPTSMPRMLAFLIVMLIPAALMACMALSVLDRGELDSRGALRGTSRWGSISLAMILVFAAVHGVFGWLAGHFGMSRALAGLASVVIAAIALQPVKKVTDRLRLRILERHEDVDEPVAHSGRPEL
ncbi:MAG: hypothetical protein ACT4O1_11330 [Gemmatimonadota bacterium]